MKTHRADGLYYVSVEMLVNAGACWFGRSEFEDGARKILKRKPTFKRKIPVTLALAEAVLRERHSAAYWVIGKMWDKLGFEIMQSHRRRADNLMRCRDKAARHLMHVLWLRAKREGRV